MRERGLVHSWISSGPKPCGCYARVLRITQEPATSKAPLERYGSNKMNSSANAYSLGAIFGIFDPSRRMPPIRPCWLNQVRQCSIDGRSQCGYDGGDEILR